ncbi:uncharacterized protein LOC128547268 [Mercenaria mercenaria]|uniref:uncharacterized protein LOC128547268 n=1 Tax=Mercenaria mercenaria TaxID=6596 RepID=UPI00234F58A5|nr:uncharacterized protein LOC128547268 [Mercenaria mercenaria]
MWWNESIRWHSLNSLKSRGVQLPLGACEEEKERKLSSMYERSNPDWAPTLKLGDILTPRKSEKKLRKLETAEKRFNRVQERQKTKEKHHIARALLALYDQPPEPEFIATPLVVKPSCSFLLMGKTEKLESPPSKIDPLSDSQVESEYQRMLTENVVLQTQIIDTVPSQASLEKNPKKK